MIFEMGSVRVSLVSKSEESPSELKQDETVVL